MLTDFFLVNRYFLVIFILNSNVLQAFVTFTVRFINVSYFSFKCRTFRASPVLRYSNHLTFSCNDDGNHLLYKTIHVTFYVFTYMHDLVFIQMTCEDLYPDLFYINSYYIPLKCTMLWISKELIKFLSCILWLFGSTHHEQSSLLILLWSSGQGAWWDMALLLSFSWRDRPTVSQSLSSYSTHVLLPPGPPPPPHSPDS